MVRADHYLMTQYSEMPRHNYNLIPITTFKPLTQVIQTVLQSPIRGSKVTFNKVSTGSGDTTIKQQFSWLGLIPCTAFFFKVMKQIFLEGISKYMEGREVILESQPGFIKGKSCLTNLVTFCDGVTALVDRGRAKDVICMIGAPQHSYLKIKAIWVWLMDT